MALFTTEQANAIEIKEAIKTVRNSQNSIQVWFNDGDGLRYKYNLENYTGAETKEAIVAAVKSQIVAGTNSEGLDTGLKKKTLLVSTKIV